MTSAADHEVADSLERDPFVARLRYDIHDLGNTPAQHLHAPRVISVDAPWGRGKSWVANRLVSILNGDAHEIGESPGAVLIDAYRFDHHTDPFAVVASSLFAALNPKGEVKNKLLSTAGAILGVGLPVAAKAMANGLLSVAAGTSLDVLSDEVAEKMVDASGSLTEKGVERMFKQYADLEKVQRAFAEGLGELLVERKSPFVIIVDELDRCRPTFALELLERIKHLFDTEKVVFVLFWNRRTITEFVSHVYGLKNEPGAYLDKFISKRLSLPPTSASRASRQPHRYKEFIQRKLATTTFRELQGVLEEDGYAVAELALVFNSEPRLVLAVLSLLMDRNFTFNTPVEYWIYGAFLLVHDPEQFALLTDPQRARMAFDRELSRLTPTAGDSSSIAKFMQETFYKLQEPVQSNVQPQDHPASTFLSTLMQMSRALHMPVRS